VLGAFLGLQLPDESVINEQAYSSGGAVDNHDEDDHFDGFMERLGAADVLTE
jgi:hypothetical protein